MSAEANSDQGVSRYPWENCRACGGARDVALAKVCKACIEGGVPFPAVGEGHGDKLTREALFDQIEEYRTAIKTALDTMAVANDEQLGPGGVARRAYAGLWHEYFAIPAGIPATNRTPASDENGETTAWPPMASPPSRGSA